MDAKSLQIDVPDDLLREFSRDELQRLAREAFSVRLYEQGNLSSGRAGALLGMSRSDFLDLLGRHGVSYFDDSTDLAEDLRNALASGAVYHSEDEMFLALDAHADKADAGHVAADE